MANNQYNFLDYAGLSLFWNNVKSIIEENELATASALTNLDTRVDNLEASKSDKGHTHTSILDVNGSSAITFAYSKAGLGYDDYTWLAGWGGYELRAVDKTQFARARHTHTKSQITDFPTSLPANGGNADTSNRTKFLETFQQNSTTNTYGSQYPIWAQWSDSTNVRLKCTNYTVWTDNATTATKIGTSTVGSSTMPVYINGGTPTAITSFPEAYLSWGGTNTSGSVTPIGMTLSSEHSANRLAFINGNALTFEYSSNAGSTWTDYGYTASIKSQVFTTLYDVPIGRANGSAEYTTNSRTRITLTAQDGTNSCYVYTNPRKMLINISSSGGMQVLIEYRTGTNYKNNGAWTTFGTYTLSGWSGWNDIPLILGTLGGGNTQTSNNWQLRLTFIMTSKYADYPTSASVNGIRIFGENSWVPPSTMAATGHLYSFDVGQNATFPGAVISAGGFAKSGGTSSQFLKADGSVDSNTYAKSGHTHKGSEVTLTGYSKVSSYSEISASDTVNQAIAKLEYVLSGLEDLLASI